jgi:hypothetical protein
VSHELCVMKNVTISMDDETLRWVRVEAARAGLSVSRWISRTVDGRLQEAAAKEEARERIKAYLESGPRFDLSVNGKIKIDRDELHDDGRFRRFNDPALRSGPTRPGEDGALRGVADDPPGHRTPGAQSSGSE